MSPTITEIFGITIPTIGGTRGGNSIGSPTMQSRDHPFNRSTRPLLERRAQPQVVSTKKLQQQQHQHQQHQYGQPKVPVRGYNDFNLISREYESWNSTNSHKGYPYGSPPSPTNETSDRLLHRRQPDFQFSDLDDGYRRAQHHQHTVNQYTVNRNNSDDDDDDDDDDDGNDYDELVYHHNQLNAGGLKPISCNNGSSNAQQQHQLRRRLLDAASPSPALPPAPPQRLFQQQQQHKTPPPPPRRTESPVATKRPVNAADIDGPFVFGVHHPNTFTPAYGVAKAATLYGATNNSTVTASKDTKDMVASSSPDSSQTSSDISCSGKSRRTLVKERKKNSKRTKAEKKEKSKDTANEKRLSAAKSSPSPTVKCVLVGDGAVGKTNLIVSYIQDRFIPQYEPTAFDKYNVDVNVDGRPICVTLCDTAGQDALDTLRQLCYPGTDVILLCFSVVRPESFRSLATKWEPEISKLKGVSVVLVGTQSDRRNDQATITGLQAQGEKPILVSTAWDFARKIGAKYVETSSHKKEGIKEVFDTAIWDALQSKEFSRRKRPLWKRLCCLTC